MRFRSLSRASHMMFVLAIGSASIAPAAAQKAGYTFVDLGSGQAYGINAAGLIVGETQQNIPQPTTGTASRPALWSRSASGAWITTDLLLGGNGSTVFYQGRANALNTQGEIVGWWTGDGQRQSFIIRPLIDNVTGAKTWYQDRGDGTHLNALMMTTNFAGASINDFTQVVSGANVIQFDSAGVETDTILPGNGGAAINNLRQVAGPLSGSASQLATVWQLDANGIILSTQTYGPISGYGWSAATAISDNGDVVGYSGKWAKAQNPAYGWRPDATLWQNGLPIALGATGDATWANGVSAVNGAVQVVGWGSSSRGQFAFRWTGGKMYDLNSLTALPSNATLIYANAINAGGLIVGQVHVAEGALLPDLYDAMVLTPK